MLSTVKYCKDECLVLQLVTKLTGLVRCPSSARKLTFALPVSYSLEFFLLLYGALSLFRCYLKCFSQNLSLKRKKNVVPDYCLKQSFSIILLFLNIYLVLFGMQIYGERRDRIVDPLVHCCNNPSQNWALVKPGAWSFLLFTHVGAETQGFRPSSVAFSGC